MITSFSKFVVWFSTAHLNCITMSHQVYFIACHPQVVSFTVSFRSFCLLKVAHLFKLASLYVLSGARCDFGSSLSIVSIVIPTHLLSLIISSQLGHIVQLALRDSSLLLLPSLTLLIPLIFPFSSSFYSTLSRPALSTSPQLSQLGHIVQLALRDSLSFRLFSRNFSHVLSFSFSFPSVRSLFLPFFICFLIQRSPACGILLSSLLLSFSQSPPSTSPFLPLICSLIFSLFCSQPRHIVWLAASLILQLLFSSAFLSHPSLSPFPYQCRPTLPILRNG